MALWATGAQLKTKFTGSSCTEAGLIKRISLQTDPCESENLVKRHLE